jgi:hypothetical protein
VHDTLLHQRISRLPAMDPGGVRITARKLAAEGLAGHEATAAAASFESDRNELILANFLLLVMLMEQVEPAGLRVSAETERSPELDRRATPDRPRGGQIDRREHVTNQSGPDKIALRPQATLSRSRDYPRRVRPGQPPEILPEYQLQPHRELRPGWPRRQHKAVERQYAK